MPRFDPAPRRPARREVDNLLLVPAKHRMNPLGDQQGQMGERAEAAIGHQDIADSQEGQDRGDAGQVMRPQRRRADLQQQPGAGVEEGQDVGH